MQDKLVIVRHGDFILPEGAGLEQISTFGRTQMTNLAQLIEVEIPELKNKKPRVICSIAPRAAQSGKAVADYFHTQAEETELLWTERGRKPNLAGVVGLLKHQTEGVPILVTHMEMVAQLTVYYFRKLKIRDDVRKSHLQLGEALILDLKTGSIQKISWKRPLGTHPHRR